MSCEQNRKVANRREFLILSVSAPLLLIPTQSEAFFPALIIRFFARNVISNFIKRGTRQVIKNVVVKNVKKRGRAKVLVKRAIQVHSRVNNLIDAHEYLSNQVWNRHKENHSTLVITNPSNKYVKTKTIKLKMKDSEKKRTEFKAKVKSMRIPPRSSVVVDLGVKKIRKTGVKKLYASHSKKHTSSGNVLVANHTRGLTIEELYRRHYQQNRGGKRHDSYQLNSNIIL